MTTKEKYEMIDKSKVPSKTLEILEKMQKASTNFTNPEVNAKIDSALDRLIEGFKANNPSALITPSQAKEKVKKEKTNAQKKNEGKDLSEKKDTDDKTGLPKKDTVDERKDIIKKESESEKEARERAKKELEKENEKAKDVIESQLEKLNRIILEDPALQGFNKGFSASGGGKSTPIIDAERKALPRGKRVSKKGWKNQYGASDGGRTYWENRENRTDRKSPDYPTGKPYLAKGGNVYSSDDVYEVKMVQDGVELDSKFIRAKNKGEARMIFEDMYQEKYQDEFGAFELEIDVAKSRLAHGGYMEHRGTITDDSLESILKSDFPKSNYQLHHDNISGHKIYGQKDVIKTIQKHLLTEYGIKSEYDKEGFGLPFLRVYSQFVDKYAQGGKTEQFFSSIQTDRLRALEDEIATVNLMLKKLQNINTEEAYQEGQNLREYKAILEVKKINLEDGLKNKGGYMADGGEVGNWRGNALGDGSIELINSGVYIRDNTGNYGRGRYDVYKRGDYDRRTSSNGVTLLASFDDLEEAKQYGYNNSYAKGGYMADGGENKLSYEEFEETLQEYEVEGGFGKTLEKGYRMYYLPNGNPYLNTKFKHRNKKKAYQEYLEMNKMGKGGYMAEGENYEYINTFKRFDSDVPVPQDDFQKLVDAYHKQLSGDKLAVVKYNVLKVQMGNYLGEKTVEEMEEYIQKTHEAHKMAHGGETESEPLGVNESVYFEVYDGNRNYGIIKFRKSGSRILETLLIGNVKAGNRRYMSYFTKNDLKLSLNRDFDVVNEVDEDYVNDRLISYEKSKPADIFVVKYPYPELAKTPDTLTIIKGGEQVFDYDPVTKDFTVVSIGLSYPDQIELDDFLEDSKGVSERQYTPELIKVIEVVKENEDISEIVNELKSKGLIQKYQYTMADGGSVNNGNFEVVSVMLNVYDQQGGEQLYEYLEEDQGLDIVSQEVKDYRKEKGVANEYSSENGKYDFVVFQKADLRNIIGFEKMMDEFFVPMGMRYTYSEQTKMSMGGFMADGGEVDFSKKMEKMRSAYETLDMIVKSKIAMAIGIDNAISIMDTDYVVHPFHLIKGEVSSGLLEIDEINGDLVGSAIQEAGRIDEDYRDSGEGIGSSDITYFTKSMLRDAGYKTEFINHRLKRVDDDGNELVIDKYEMNF